MSLLVDKRAAAVKWALCGSSLRAPIARCDCMPPLWTLTLVLSHSDRVCAEALCVAGAVDGQICVTNDDLAGHCCVQARVFQVAVSDSVTKAVED